MRPVAFLDRDGTINVKAPEGQYVRSPEEMVLLPGAAAAVRRLNDAGVPVAVVTNQRGLARGLMTEADLTAIHSRMAELLQAQAGAHVDVLRYCPHAGGGCRCRKPLPGMLEEAAKLIGPVDLGRSIMIGDAESDVAAGRAFGVRTVWLGVDSADLSHAVDTFLRDSMQS